jgi:GT2 family glycosyltransferase
VSILMPFLGSGAEARAALGALAAVELRPGDEIVVADNTVERTMRAAVADHRAVPIVVVAAPAERSAYYARNVAAEHATNGWYVFLDADCRPAPTLLDDYFAEPPAPDVGAVVGRIVPERGQESLVARWAASREVLSQERSFGLPGGPAGATANLLVRRDAWAGVGGFLEGVPSGEDFDFCWRIQDAGWKLELNPSAVVEHLHRESLGPLLRQFSMYAAGDAWLNRRRPGSVPRPRLASGLLRAAAGMPGFALTGRFERAAMKALDAMVVCAQAVGYRRGNASTRRSARGWSPAGLVAVADRFPPPDGGPSLDPVDLIAREGSARVEALARPDRPALGAGREITVNWLEDEGPLDRARALVALFARHPIRCASDLIRRRRSGDDGLPLRALAPAALRLDRGGASELRVDTGTAAAGSAVRIGYLTGTPVRVGRWAKEPHSIGTR